MLSPPPPKGVSKNSLLYCEICAGSGPTTVSILCKAGTQHILKTAHTHASERMTSVVDPFHPLTTFHKLKSSNRVPGWGMRGVDNAHNCAGGGPRFGDAVDAVRNNEESGSREPAHPPSHAHFVASCFGSCFPDLRFVALCAALSVSVRRSPFFASRFDRQGFRLEQQRWQTRRSCTCRSMSTTLSRSTR